MIPAEFTLKKDRKELVYISGPMTGYEDFNFPAFNEAARLLQQHGYDVVNPAEHGVVEGAEWEDYLRYDLIQLARCTSIVLLPGWEASRGANLEVHVARRLGLNFIELPG
jgi:hypothetical protein